MNDLFFIQFFLGGGLVLLLLYLTLHRWGRTTAATRLFLFARLFWYQACKATTSIH